MPRTTIPASVHERIRAAATAYATERHHEEPLRTNVRFAFEEGALAEHRQLAEPDTTAARQRDAALGMRAEMASLRVQLAELDAEREEERDAAAALVDDHERLVAERDELRAAVDRERENANGYGALLDDCRAAARASLIDRLEQLVQDADANHGCPTTESVLAQLLIDTINKQES